MSKRSPGSKHGMRIAKERYRKERERFRAKLQRRREQQMIQAGVSASLPSGTEPSSMPT